MLLIRTSISNTKKYFHRTLESFKSFLYGGYQRLPRTPPFNPCACSRAANMNSNQSYCELDMFNKDLTNQWDTVEHMIVKKKKKSQKKTISTTVEKHEEGVSSNYSIKVEEQKKKKFGYEGRRKEDPSFSLAQRQERNYLMRQRLKELEMMDKSNVEHVLDIEEVLHYYSRLNCPAYLDIVDRFFVDMYTELCSFQAQAQGDSSRTRLRSAMV
ncbi:unnamed protein product [Ilex paraguariensis]|uniref:OVATE domain-containing protein n=1 Tax=Ilex paraguariensis TaxID=185542 RepID=A0ABC8TMI9_9AQUA